jgi:hypothetical protein
MSNGVIAYCSYNSIDLDYEGLPSVRASVP